jgi:hypothetical protein
MRIKSHSKGEAFNVTIDFKTAIVTIPGYKYGIKMFTLINCAKIGCEEAKDSISVKIKDGDNGQYNEVYNINGRTRDVKWNMENFNITATQNKIHVRF